MREILFKAKRKDNGKWVCGYLIERISSIKDIKDIVKNKHSFIHGQKLIYSHNWPDKIMDYEYEVGSETICQYTGLTDKNGRKVFDGDLVKCFYEDFINGEIVSETHICDMENYYCMLRIISACYIEVIGNIHDGEENHV